MLNFKNANPNQLVNELQKTGIDFSTIRITSDLQLNEWLAANVWIEADESQVLQIQMVVSAHVPAPPQLPIIQQLAATDAGMARVAEDIFELLVDEGKTFPQSVIDKIAERKALRAAL